MKIGYQPHSTIQQANVVKRFATLIENTFTTREGREPWETRNEKVRGISYHLATKKSDNMTPETAAKVIEAIKDNEFAMGIFALALTGYYRDPRFGDGARRRDAEDEIIRTAEEQYRPNSPEENIELINRVNIALGRDFRMYLGEKDAEFLNTQLSDSIDSKEDPMEGEKEISRSRLV